VDKILETTITVDINEIQNKQLLKIAKLESKLSSFWIKKLRSMIIPRLDMIDIFYCYQDILELPENKLTELIKNFNLPSF